MKPLFSCVVPVKGRRPYFESAMASLQAQDMGDALEVIVQDGDVKSDLGQSDALNRGFAKSHGEWLFWLNADDLLLPNALRRVQSVLQTLKPSNSPAWLVGNQMYIDAEGRVLKCLRGNGWHDWLYRQAVPHVNGPSAFFRRELFERVGGFDCSLNICMDWDLWIRFMRSGARFVRLNDYLWAQRQWAGSKTQRVKSADEEVVQAAEVRRMLAKNGFRMTRLGDWGVRMWRALNGNYLMGALDTLKKRGRLP